MAEVQPALPALPAAAAAARWVGRGGACRVEVQAARRVASCQADGRVACHRKQHEGAVGMGACMMAAGIPLAGVGKEGAARSAVPGVASPGVALEAAQEGACPVAGQEEAQAGACQREDLYSEEEAGRRRQ